jgi:hypothetical protein
MFNNLINNKMTNRIFLTGISVAMILATSCGGRANNQAVVKGIEQQEVAVQTETTVAKQPDIDFGSSLAPAEIGEFVSPDNDAEDDTYLYSADPNGKFFHFEGFVSQGDSQWDTFWKYEEEFTASSTLAPSGANRYGAENLRNDIHRNEGGGIRATAWVEGAAGYGVGENVKMSVKTKAQLEGKDDEINFRSLLIVNGYAKDAATWKNNSRVKILRLYVGDKHWCDLHLEDIIKPQIFDFPENLQIYPAKSGKQIPEKNRLDEDDNPKTLVYQTDLSFEIIEVYRGERFDDTCITGIALNVQGGIY